MLGTMNWDKCIPSVIENLPYAHEYDYESGKAIADWMWDVRTMGLQLPDPIKLTREFCNELCKQQNQLKRALQIVKQKTPDDMDTRISLCELMSTNEIIITSLLDPSPVRTQHVGKLIEELEFME